MAAFEDSYKAQLQGVSQQLPKDRLDGQLTEQLNMISDPVTNLRRRPGAQFAYSFVDLMGSDARVAAWSTNIGELECHIVANAGTGTVQVTKYDAAAGAYTSLLSFQNPYLIATNAANLRTAAVGNELFFVNMEQTVQAAPPDTTKPPGRRAFFEVLAGAFNKKYEVSVTGNSGTTITVSYTTPTGANTGDANLSTPQHIASQLAGQINTAVGFGIAATPPGSVTAYLDLTSSTVFLLDAFVLTPVSTLKVSTTAGKLFITASGDSYVSDANLLPAAMPQDGGNLADGYIVATGSVSAPVYYKYVASTLSWLEVGEFLSPGSLTNVPISVRRGVAANFEPAVVVVDTAFEGRFAGDALSNPNPPFVGQRITGVGSYEGRLVLMTGNLVTMSASGKPRRWYRSTVTSVLDGDVISVGASAAASASWTQATQYGQDLLVFSSRYQGVVPGGNSALTPRTATLRVLSEYSGDDLSTPVNTGRTVMFAKPVSDAYFGIMEMVASQYADSTYTSYEATGHIPRYMQGRCRLAVSAPSANMVAFLSSVERNTLVVHEYTWQGDTKVQQAWHKWSFALPVASAFFSGSRLHLVFSQNERIIVLQIDSKASVSIDDDPYRAPLDFSAVYTLVAGRAAIPGWVSIGLTAQMPGLVACVGSGMAASEPLRLTSDTGEFVASDLPEGKAIIGLPFTSRVEFTPPMLKDHNGVRVTTNKATVSRFVLGTNASREFDVSVSDQHSTDVQPYTVSPLNFSSTELELGHARVGGPNSAVTIPARTLAESTRLITTSGGTGEMNITSLEYVMKTKEQIQRKKG